MERTGIEPVPPACKFSAAPRRRSSLVATAVCILEFAIRRRWSPPLRSACVPSGGRRRPVA